VQTPAEHAQRLAGDMQDLASRLRASEGEDAPVFSREDVDRLVEERLGRERKKRRRVEEERDELEEELERLRQTRQDAVYSDVQ
jgi:hypothetical protein